MRHKGINKNRADAGAQSTQKELDLTQKELSAATLALNAPKGLG